MIASDHVERRFHPELHFHNHHQAETDRQSIRECPVGPDAIGVIAADVMPCMDGLGTGGLPYPPVHLVPLHVEFI